MLFIAVGTDNDEVVAPGTEIVTCGQAGGDPKGDWFCHLDATPCTAPTTP